MGIFSRGTRPAQPAVDDAGGDTLMMGQEPAGASEGDAFAAARCAGAAHTCGRDTARCGWQCLPLIGHLPAQRQLSILSTTLALSLLLSAARSP
jgi:twitching motility protein PilJ